MATRKKPKKRFSATFLAFAKPAFDRKHIQPETPTGETLLRTCWAVWNAVVFADIGGEPDHLEQLRDPANVSPASRILIDWLAERKRTHFAAERWLVGDCTLKQVRGEWRLRIEARAAPIPPERSDR